jgi:hypothetical protein
MAINRLAKPFEAVGLAEMMEQRKHVERANIELLAQIRNDLTQHAPDETSSPFRPAFWQKIFRFRKGRAK